VPGGIRTPQPSDPKFYVLTSYRGTKRYSGYIEVCTHRGRLAAYVRHRRGAEKDRRCGEVPGLSASEKTRRAKKAGAMNVGPRLTENIRKGQGMVES